MTLHGHCVLLAYPRSGSFLAWDILQKIFPDYIARDFSRDRTLPDVVIDWSQPTLTRLHDVELARQLFTADVAGSATLITVVRRDIWAFCVSKTTADRTAIWQPRTELPQHRYPRPEQIELDYQQIKDQADHYLRTWVPEFRQFAAQAGFKNTIALDFDQLIDPDRRAQHIRQQFGHDVLSGDDLDSDLYRMPWRAQDIVSNYRDLYEKFCQEFLPDRWYTHA